MLNYESMLLVFSFLVAFLVTFAATPLAKIVAYKIGAVDIPKDSRRVHKEPIARLGGLAIFYGFIISVLSFGQMDKGIRGVLIGALIIVILGVIDDVKPLTAKVKLVVQIVAALVVVFQDVQIDFIKNPSLLQHIFGSTDVIVLDWLAIPITVIWIVGVTNAVNLIDGLDGLAAGICSIASISILFIALLLNQPAIALITAAIAGSCLGFLPYNFNPAKIFMGDSGATFLGFVLAAVSIQGLFKVYAAISFIVPVLILGLPIFDTGFAIFRRLLNGKSIMEADRGHLHHRLIDMGFSQKQTVMILYTLSGILGISAVVITGSGIMRATVLILSLLVFVIAGAKYMQPPAVETPKSDEKESTEE